MAYLGHDFECTVFFMACIPGMLVYIAFMSIVPIVAVV